MKILFINSSSADYVQDLTYSGLVKLLGVKNVIDFHWNKKFHIPYKKYPKNLGYVSGSLVPSLLHRSFNHIDAVIIGAAKREAFETYLEIIDHIPAHIPIIFIDGGDQSDIGGGVAFEGSAELYNQAINKRPFDLIFKREYLLEDNLGNHVFPFPISFNLDRLPKLSNKTKYDVSFWAVETHSIRVQVLELLQEHFDCRANGTSRNQKFSQYKRKGDFYLQELAACKIILNFRGGGWDTLRYWEIPAVQSLMITQKPGIKIPNDFQSGKHVIHCQDDLSDLIELCDYYLKHDDKRIQIAKAGFEHLKEYHTDIARASYLLEKIQIFKG